MPSTPQPTEAEWRAKLAPVKARLRAIADGLRALQEMRGIGKGRRAFARYADAEREIVANAR